MYKNKVNNNKNVFLEILLLVSCKQGNPYYKGGKIKKNSNTFELSLLRFTAGFPCLQNKKSGNFQKVFSLTLRDLATPT